MTKNKEIEKINFSELLLSRVNLIVISCDGKGILNYVSPSSEVLTGYKPQSLLGKNWWNLIFLTKEEGQSFKNELCNVANKVHKEPNTFESRLKCKDGSIKWIEWSNTLAENNTIVCVGVDVTNRKKTEEINIQSDMILNSIDSMVFVSDKNGDIIYANPSVETMLGYSVEEILGDKWWKVTFENPNEALKVKNATINFVFHLVKSFVEISKRKIKTKNGEYKWIEWQVSKGVNDTFISIGTDITSKFNIEEELKNAKESAEKSLKVKNDFLANMSHEIRTPLNAVIGFTDLLLETELTKEQEKHLGTMRSSGEILLSLINNVLDLSKLESDKLEIEAIDFDLHKNVFEVVNLMKIKAKEKGISLDLIIDNNVPKNVIGDPTRIDQIILNLVGNAVKFTNKGSVTVSLKLIQETTEISTVYFEIKDTGIGIVSNKINTVFGVFTQAKSDTSRIYGGTGLGLAIVKKLVKLLNGKITIESQFGIGSVFKMTLPLKKGIVEEPKKEFTVKDSMSEPLSLNILLVEDNKTNQLLAKTRLERWDCKVDIANNGIEGVKKIQNKMYDIVLMDIQMPVMDGYEATHIIKNDLSKEVSKVPIIAMTAYTSKNDINRALKIGMSDYVFKPFKPFELYSILKKYGNIVGESKDIEVVGSVLDSEIEDVNKYIDLKFLREETFNESSVLKLLIELFLKDLEDFVDNVNIAFEKKNWNELHKETHKIKPNIFMFGISKLEPIIHVLLNSFREEKNLENVEALILKMKEIIVLVKEELIMELKSIK